jgi:putative ABC transport system ATP-binding protein
VNFSEPEDGFSVFPFSAARKTILSSRKSTSNQMLQLENIKKGFVEPDGRLLPILDVQKFSVNEGQQVVLLGPSGCGKTTLLHVIAGICRPDSGIVRIDGTNIVELSEAGCDRFRAAKIGYVFQTFNLLAGFSALENVMLGMTFARGRNDVPARARRLLERVGLGKRETHKPRALSVGEQQRVAVARALANRPRLLLADEPTASVDAANQQNIVNLIRETCREENVALIIVTHDMEVAEQFDHIVRLDEVNRVVNGAAASKNA